MSERGDLDTIMTILRAVAEPTRLRLLIMLARLDLTVSEITQIVGQSQPRVSRHLKLLTDAGLIERFSEGTWAFYRLSDDGVAAVAARRIAALVDTGDKQLLRDSERLEDVRRARAQKAASYFRKNAANWDRIRSLHVPEEEVEKTLLEKFGDAEINDLLDVGTGTGRMLELFAPRIKSGIGIDLSREMLGLARANLDREELRHIQVRQGDMYRLDLEDESVDAVIFHQVLHFADDPQSALSEAARVLRPGGRIAVIDFLPHALEYLRDEHNHRRLGFSDKEVAGWFEKLGLSLRDNQHLAGKKLTVGLWVARRETGS